MPTGTGATGRSRSSDELRPDRLTIEVIDDGPGFDYVEADGEDRELTEGGLGIADHPVALRRVRARRDASTGGGSRLRLRRRSRILPSSRSAPGRRADALRPAAQAGYAHAVSERRRLIVVSNRGPVTYTRDEAGRIARRGGGGLVTALAPLVSRHDVTWVANAHDATRTARSPPRPAARSTRPGATARRYRLRLVAHDPADFDRFYNEFANPALWFLQHELWD